MIWPNELIIKRDATNTKIANPENLINFINSYNNLYILEKYLSSLKMQTKLSNSEVEPIINVVEERTKIAGENLEKFLNNYELKKENLDLLADFYEENIDFIRGIFNDYKNIQNIGNTNLNILVNFFRFCVEREKDLHQNKLRTQKLFNDFYLYFKEMEGKLEEDKYTNIFNDIINTKNEILNKKDDSAMDYKEVGYQTAQSLVLARTPNNGHALTEDEPLELNKAAFVTTAIILQATLVGTLILSLLALVK